MAEQKKIAFHTLGCKLNFSETDAISRQFADDAYVLVDFSEPADIYVINSCTVTKNAEKRCKTLIRQALKNNYLAHLVVVGCYSQIKPAELLAIPGVAMVLGNAEKFNLFGHLKRLEEANNDLKGFGIDRQGVDEPEGFNVPENINDRIGVDDPESIYVNENVNDMTGVDKKTVVNDMTGFDDTVSVDDKKGVAKETLTEFIPTFSTGGRTRSFFKVQDGCDYKCSYCTIPLARGHSRSDSIAGTIETARKIAQTDMKEIVLTGVNIGDFGKQHGESFHDLLEELTSIDGIERIRLSSVEPDLLHDDIIRLVAAESKLMPHFHIPLQSGCDSILKAMGRRYNTALFADRIESIRKHIPHACIAADLIVGYPGETDAMFNESMNFISGMDVSYIHVFTYSERENTRALKQGQAVHPAERKKRSKAMQQLSSEMKKQFIQSNRGLITTVLWENSRRNGYMFGFTENYIKIKTPFDKQKVNTIERVRLDKTDKSGVYEI